MKISIDWGKTNTLYVESRVQDLKIAARELVSFCEKRCEKYGVDVIQFEVGVTLTMRTLIDNHLLDMNFTLIDTVDSSVDLLTYTRNKYSTPK